MIINEKEYKITISYNNLKGKYILEEVDNLDLYIEVNSQRKSLMLITWIYILKLILKEKV